MDDLLNKKKHILSTSFLMKLLVLFLVGLTFQAFSTSSLTKKTI